MDLKNYRLIRPSSKESDFMTNSASSHGLIGEQVNNDAMKPSWVIGLTWSHAMYIIVLAKLLEYGDAS